MFVGRHSAQGHVTFLRTLDVGSSINDSGSTSILTPAALNSQNSSSNQQTNSFFVSHPPFYPLDMQFQILAVALGLTSVAMSAPASSPAQGIEIRSAGASIVQEAASTEKRDVEK